ncbi:tRNA(Ile)-lysidine synthase [Rhizobium mongolense subsp. loessense]|uniref:tRNA(Ile)-lysidine synthase n=1 Tax=Rhizobium mongolense subsp. loessense TaxID=158890 RepID=A0A1G4SVC3_9HYPH|nr:tRNA lysidine(34) synthetase TilS [Rhizobium mongolense]SCW73110.1 tRNA(Ile)-lysidine synthase [Rhizobium mongolense subsp. loessense]
MSPEIVLSPEAAVRRFLRSLESPARILVAISGGSDSTGLLLALLEALKAEPNSKISLCAATIDHDLRAESADEARHVAALCKSLGIAHVIRVWREPKPKTGIMGAAREARYELLAGAAEELGANLIVTAHTLDDQRETQAMRGARSGNPSTGIADAVLFERRVWIARPLLSCLRADIRAFLSARAVPWLDDPSNEDLQYERVRTRAALAGEGAPEPEAYGADIRLELSRQAALWLGRHFTLPCEGLGRVAGKGLEAPPDVLGYALGRLAAVFGGQRFAPGRMQMDRILAFVSAGMPGRMTASRAVLDLRRDGLYLARESRGILPLVVAPGEHAIWDGRFVIENSSSYDLTVLARSATPLVVTGIQPGRAAHLPKAALKRALAAQPRILVAGDANVCMNSHPDVSLTRYFALFDRFLTRFDLIFAERLAAAFGMRPYPSPPLSLIDGKAI